MQGSRTRGAWRRLLTVPGYALACLLWIGAAPLWLVVAAIVDASRGHRAVALRSGAFVAWYLSCEMLGVAVSAALWSWRVVARTDESRWIDLHYRLEAWWGTALFGGLRRLFGLRVEVEDDAQLGRGPYLLLLRHASTADTLLASALVSRPHGIRLRYVLKRELLWDPCLDIVGQRAPNVFVDRFSDDSAEETRRIAALASGLGPSDGVLIYPEGTRFSEAKRGRVIERLEQRGETQLLEAARAFVQVLPPRVGGTLALLDAAPRADVVIGVHVGFEGAASLGRIWRGALVDQTIRVRFRRVARAEIPPGRDARAAWLVDEWRRVDAWVGSHSTS